MPSHHDPAAEHGVHRIQVGQRAALRRREKLRQNCAAPGIEILRHSIPVERLTPLGDFGSRIECRFGQGAHARASRSRSARFRSTPHR